MLRNKLLIPSVVLITLMSVGCATAPPVIKVVTQQVEVPIAVPCKQEIPTPPDYCFSKLTEDMGIFEKVRCLLSDRTLSKGYEIELEAALKACK